MSALIGTWRTRRGVKIWHPQDPDAFQRWRKGDVCGTDRGYRRHIAASEPPCDSCRLAHNQLARRWR